MLNLWRQASEKTSSASQGSADTPTVNGSKRPSEDSEHPAKKRKFETPQVGHPAAAATGGMSLSAQAMSDLPRPVISPEEAFAKLGEQNGTCWLVWDSVNLSFTFAHLQSLPS